MAQSFHDKVLRVDLTAGTVSVESPGPVYFRRYFGGWNIIADVLLKEVPAGTDPLGPANKLIFAPGVLTGLPISGASRSAVGAKSPLTGGFGAAEAGGNFGAQLKRAGFDALIVEGAAAHPVYLWIKDGEVEIRDASDLWGMPTKETEAALRKALGSQRVEAAMIGPGGESLVRYACIMNGTKDAAGRTGLGAVMGSKKLKAVAVLGTRGLEAHDQETVMALAREMAQGVNAGERAKGLHTWGTGVGLDGGLASGNLPVRNFRDGDFEGVDNLSADHFMPTIGVGMEGCYACAIRCKKMVKADGPIALDPDYGGPEYESIGALGSTCGVNDILAVSKATELCNAYSLDTISTGVTIAFAMECFERGLISLEQTGGIDLRFGNGDAVIQMVEMIARREGIGDLLAEGSLRASRAIGHGSEAWAVQAKGQEYPMHEPRLKRGMAIGYAISPTGADHCHSLHDTGLVHPDEQGFTQNGRLRGMGVLEPVPLESLGPAKVRASLHHSMRQAALNCLCLCLFVPWSSDDEVRLVRAATGWDVTDYEIQRVGERAWTLARAFNAREGFGPADDHLSARSHEPTTSGALSETAIDAAELHDAMTMAYGMLGWDRETGVPTLEKLHDLDVGWAATTLA
ncbi:MAG: aldehyde ferredoxin oxidoreductase family protein [Anaerolineae bacterium]|nr:aldehyde ferredoxin oxidoreductase family protein [Anaerolineae bacterium]